MPKMRNLLLAGVAAVASVAVAGEMAIGLGSGPPSALTSDPVTTPTYQPPAAAPPAAAPRTSLSLGSKLRLLNQANGEATLDSTHHSFTGILTKRGSSKQMGTAAYMCVARSAGVQECKGALALRGGVLVVNLTTSAGSIAGKVTGGNGSYAGATGNLSGHVKAQGAFTLTIHYSVS